MKLSFFAILTIALTMVITGQLDVWATEVEIALTIQNHHFEPTELHVPSDKKFKLIVHNQDPTAEEFESYELNREKLIAPESIVTIYLGPLAVGRYPFFGDFHESIARGAIIAE